ncbi:hypothetical protein RIR_jg11136.t1 [Rhizophagus irregularis DAOM 181602=DAOM 197198]|nr:hypothetical protein RIR_jg11136.t1 [Rhizophagus irregularis DAOM 181602=DAOM 197198]
MEPNNEYLSKILLELKTSYGPTCSTEQENINVSNHIGSGLYRSLLSTSYDSQYTIEDTAVVGALAERVKEKLNILVFLNVPPKYKAHLVTAVQVNIYFIVNIDIIT